MNYRRCYERNGEIFSIIRPQRNPPSQTLNADEPPKLNGKWPVGTWFQIRRLKVRQTELECLK